MSIPEYATRTSRKPFEVNGVKFASYRTGILQYAVFSEDGRCRVYRLPHSTLYRASVDGKHICGKSGQTKIFRSESSALVAAAATWKATPL